mgnify:CR=1 FL=1
MPARSRRWIPLDEVVVDALQPAIANPGIIVPLQHGALPHHLQRFTGVTSYFAATFESPTATQHDFRVVGELLVARHDQTRDATTNYIFAFGIDGGRDWYFRGPFYPYRHHAPVGEHTAVQSLFFHSPFAPGRSDPSHSL